VAGQSEELKVLQKLQDLQPGQEVRLTLVSKSWIPGLAMDQQEAIHKANELSDLLWQGVLPFQGLYALDITWNYGVTYEMIGDEPGIGEGWGARFTMRGVAGANYHPPPIPLQVQEANVWAAVFVVAAASAATIIGSIKLAEIALGTDPDPETGTPAKQGLFDVVAGTDEKPGLFGTLDNLKWVVGAGVALLILRELKKTTSSGENL
jgi:hypothetical protein